MAGICKKCLLRGMAEADREMIEKYRAAIKASDQIDEAGYEARLAQGVRLFECGYVRLLRRASRGGESRQLSV